MTVFARSLLLLGVLSLNSCDSNSSVLEQERETEDLREHIYRIKSEFDEVLTEMSWLEDELDEPIDIKKLRNAFDDLERDVSDVEDLLDEF